MLIMFKTGLLIFQAEICFNSFDRASSLVLRLDIVLCPYKRDAVRPVGWNLIVRHKTIIHSKACIQLLLNSSFCISFHSPLNPHPNQELSLKPVWMLLNLFVCINKIGLSIRPILLPRIWQLKCPRPREFGIHRKKKANSRRVISGGKGGLGAAEIDWFWLMCWCEVIMICKLPRQRDITEMADWYLWNETDDLPFSRRFRISTDIDERSSL